jgi:hypothetical protein
MRVFRPALFASRLAAALALALPPLAGAQPVLAQTRGELERYQQRLEQLFERLDRNGDRRLTPAEVQGHPYLQRHFQRLDRQGRGYLVPADLSPANPSVHGERAQQFFTSADRNGNGRIDRQEADAYPWLERRFNAIDSNGDGGISREELMNLRKRQAGGS